VSVGSLSVTRVRDRVVDQGSENVDVGSVVSDEVRDVQLAESARAAALMVQHNTM